MEEDIPVRLALQGGRLRVSDLYSSWLKLISLYSIHKLTKQGDKLITLAGLLHQWKALVKQPLGQENRYGLFLKDMERLILYYPCARETRQTSPRLGSVLVIALVMTDIFPLYTLKYRRRQRD